MKRLTLFLLGSLGVFAAWSLITNSETPAETANRKAISAREAAARLQEAWADHHTRA